MSIAENLKALEALRPVADLKVMDLVAEAGIDVSGWAVTQDGNAVINPRANPSYCYEWAFGEESEPIALCVWFETLIPDSQQIFYAGNLREKAKELEEIAFDRKVTAAVRSRAKGQAKRCDRFDRRLQRAARSAMPLRIILLVGDRADGLGHDSSKVSLRRLDDAEWCVHDYEMATGRFRLVRGVPKFATESSPDSAVEPEAFVDQFSLPGEPARSERVVDTYIRSAEVRRLVLKRAAGVCECCGRQGFLTDSGKIYLETHHVIPLSEGGLDVVGNVAAICPDDHKRAHFAADRAQIRAALLSHLTQSIPASTARVDPADGI